MDEKERSTLVKNCLRDYYEEDKKILLDSSVTQIACITFMVYNLIFFGNKIIIPKETLTELIKLSKCSFRNEKGEIRTKNARYLLHKLREDTRSNYNVIRLQGETKYLKIKKFLLENPDCIFYLVDDSLYRELKENGVNNQQLYLLQTGIRETDPFESKNFKFETIGAIRFKNQKMMIFPKDGVVIKVYNSKGVERAGYVKEVKIRDFVLIKKARGGICSFKLYQIVSGHTRNHAIRIIWTDLKEGQKNNKYIDELPYEYRKMILENI